MGLVPVSPQVENMEARAGEKSRDWSLTRDSKRGHDSLQSQELGSRSSAKGGRAVTDLWDGTGSLPRKNAAPPGFSEDTNDETLKAQRLTLGLPEHAWSGTNRVQRRPGDHLLLGSEGPARSLHPDCSHNPPSSKGPQGPHMST